jgi:hypothetical protein
MYGRENTMFVKEEKYRYVKKKPMKWLDLVARSDRWKLPSFAKWLTPNAPHHIMTSIPILQNRPSHD